MPSANAPATRRNVASRVQLLERIRAEFEAMPCLRLTTAQARRLFGLRADVCERVLATLVRAGTLTCGADARFSIRDDAWHAGTSRMAALSIR